MDDTLLVRRFERLGDLFRNGQRFFDRQPFCPQPFALCSLPFDPFRQCRPFDELEHEGVLLAAVFEAVDRSDIRVIEGGEHLRFAPEARETIRIARKRVGQHFQRDLAIELQVTCAIHLAHAARAEGRQNFIGTEARAVSKRH
jgi:hypothetical protein